MTSPHEQDAHAALRALRVHDEPSARAVRMVLDAVETVAAAHDVSAPFQVEMRRTAMALRTTLAMHDMEHG